jgi:hypothetical protein
MSASSIATEAANSADIEPLLKIEDAARLLGRAHWTLRHDVAAGRLKCIRLGRRLMFEPAEIRRVIEAARR